MISLKRASITDIKIITDIHTRSFNDEMQKIQGRDGGPPGYNSAEESARIIKELKTYLIVYREETIGFFPGSPFPLPLQPKELMHLP